MERPGEYAEYIDIAVEYFEHVFTDVQTRLKRAEESAVLAEMVSFELEKNSRMLSIMEKRVPSQDIPNANVLISQY